MNKFEVGQEVFIGNTEVRAVVTGFVITNKIFQGSAVVYTVRHVNVTAREDMNCYFEIQYYNKIETFSEDQLTSVVDADKYILDAPRYIGANHSELKNSASGSYDSFFDRYRYILYTYDDYYKCTWDAHDSISNKALMELGPPTEVIGGIIMNVEKTGQKIQDMFYSNITTSGFRVPIECQHTYAKYEGFTESYSYCTKCDKKDSQS